MKINYVLTIGALACGLVNVPVHAQDKKDQSIKEDVKDAGKSTAHAAKKTGKKMKHGTKKAMHKAASATEKGADKVKDKTKP